MGKEGIGCGVVVVVGECGSLDHHLCGFVGLPIKSVHIIEGQGESVFSSHMVKEGGLPAKLHMVF